MIHDEFVISAAAPGRPYLRVLKGIASLSHRPSQLMYCSNYMTSGQYQIKMDVMELPASHIALL